MKQIIIILLTLLVVSCSQEKRIAKFVKKNGPKEVAEHIAINYPEYLRVDTISVRDSFPYPVTLKVPEFLHDTVLDKDTINKCLLFDYNDSRLQFHIGYKNGKQQVNYKIKERTIHDTLTIIREVKVPGPPCPTEALVQDISKKYEMKLYETNVRLKLYRNLLFLLLLILVGYFGFKYFKKHYLNV